MSELEDSNVDRLKELYDAFFRENENDYSTKIRDAIQDGSFRLVVNINHLRAHDSNLPRRYVMDEQERLK